MTTLISRVEAAAGTAGVLTFVTGNRPDPVSFGQLLTEAQAVAARLQARGIGPGDHVALLGPTSRDLVTALEGIWLSGATLVVLPLPMRMGSIEEFVAQTRRRMLHADVTLLLIDGEFAPFVNLEAGDPPMEVLGDLVRPQDGPSIDHRHYERPKDDPEALAVLQFTSGSTSDPKGVMLLNKTICANLDAIAAAVDLDPRDDVMVSWLPLYHDMGLVGCLMLPLGTGMDLALGAPQDFLASPLRWMQWLSDFGGTATAGPNFSWTLAARALRNAEGLDLSRMRIALNGAEPVDPTTVRRFVAAAEPFGFRPGAVFPAFGMAEVMIAGSFPRPLDGLRVDHVDKRVLETERYAAPVAPDAAGVRPLARLGAPVPGLEFRVVDPADGRVCAEREVGELQIRGTSVTPGYYKRPDANAAAFDGDWFRTGDLAYLADGEMVMCGRIKDVIIVGGRNVFPEDVERAVNEIDGVRAGNVIAFGVDVGGKEGVVVVAETKSEDLTPVRRSVAERVRAAVGLPAKDIVLVAPGTLPKTSSGKLQRSLCRQRYLGQELAIINA